MTTRLKITHACILPQRSICWRLSSCIPGNHLILNRMFEERLYRSDETDGAYHQAGREGTLLLPLVTNDLHGGRLCHVVRDIADECFRAGKARGDLDLRAIIPADGDLLIVHLVVFPYDGDLWAIGADQQAVRWDQPWWIGTGDHKFHLCIHARQQCAVAIAQLHLCQQGARGGIEGIGCAHHLTGKCLLGELLK